MFMSFREVKISFKVSLLYTDDNQCYIILPMCIFIVIIIILGQSSIKFSIK